jgi:ABC-type uncharacterized transport system ATPase subunit
MNPSIGRKQALELLKSLSKDAGVISLDEGENFPKIDF